MLRILLGFICFFMVTGAHAELTEQLFVLQGDFALSENMKVNSVRRSEMVDGLTQKGSERLRQLKSEAYACKQNTAVHWTCTKLLTPEPLTEDLKIKMKTKWDGLLISFKAPSLAPVQVQNVEGLQSWLVEQKVIVRTSFESEPKVSLQVSYLRSFTENYSRWLVALGDYRMDNPTILSFEDENTLGIVDIFEVNEGNVKLRYYVDLSLGRIQ